MRSLEEAQPEERHRFSAAAGNTAGRITELKPSRADGRIFIEAYSQRLPSPLPPHVNRDITVLAARMKILYVITRAERGGAQVHLLDLIANLPFGFTP